MDEIDFIDLLRPLSSRSETAQSFDLRDDAALLNVSPGHDLVLSSDTMVEGVHFPKGRIGGGFSERLLRTALSDLAAKAATPVGYMLNVAWPRGRDPKWIKGFVRGLHDAQETFDCPILGGDTTATEGPLVANVTVFGQVPVRQIVLRSGAQVGDDIWYTGTLGRAEMGLKIVMGDTVNLSPVEFAACEEAYLRPVPRFLFRKALRQYATACADISDGILTEASHIAAASHVCLDLEPPEGSAFGDDYELLFTAHPKYRDDVEAAAKAINLRVTRCGQVQNGQGVLVNGQSGAPSGYRHTLD